VARSALLTLAVVILFAALLYLTSFIVFVLRQSGVWLAPGFGLNGWLVFLSGLPWGLLLLSLVFVLILAALLNRYELVYRHPLFYAILLLAIINTIASFWVAATSFHERVFEYSAENLPLVGNFYQFETEEPASIHRGVIIAAAPDAFIIADARGITSTVTAAREAGFSNNFAVGDTVVVFGEREPDGEIEAFGIEKTME